MRRCPCASGWTCDTARDICVPSDGLDGGGASDAGVDAGDPGPADTGSAPVDSGPAEMDAPQIEVDAGLDDTSCDDIYAGAIFCDGFESGDFMRWSSSMVTAGAMATLVDTPVYRGARAMNGTAPIAGGSAWVRKLLSPAIASGEIHLRAYVYLPSTVTLSVVVEILTIGNGGDVHTHMALDPDGRVTLISGPTYSTGLIMPRDRWVCAQLSVVVDPALGRAALALDGMPAGFVNDIPTVPSTGGYPEFGVGLWQGALATTDIGVYVDEVVLDDAPVPCD